MPWLVRVISLGKLRLLRDPQGFLYVQWGRRRPRRLVVFRAQRAV